MKNKKLLNLYAGLGGNRKLWSDVRVTAVEQDPRVAKIYSVNFPGDECLVQDAPNYLLEYYRGFHFIWSSPPCPTHSKMSLWCRKGRNGVFPDLVLYQQIIFLKHFFKGYWVVENVKPYYQPLIDPTFTCGRHVFWSNFEIPAFEAPVFPYPDFIKDDSPVGVSRLKDWLGIQYDGNVYVGKSHSPAQVLRNCVHPLVGLHILNSVPV